MAALRRVLGDGVDVVDGPGIVAEAVRSRLGTEGLLHDGTSTGEHRFSVSDLTPGFERSATRFFGNGFDLAYDPLWA